MATSKESPADLHLLKLDSIPTLPETNIAPKTLGIGRGLAVGAMLVVGSAILNLNKPVSNMCGRLCTYFFNTYIHDLFTDLFGV